MDKRKIAMEDKILEWIGDYSSGSLTENDAAELRIWLDGSERNRQLFYRAVSDIKIYNALSAADAAKGTYCDVLNKAGKRNKRKIVLRWCSAAAVASFAIVAIATQLFENQEHRIIPGTTKAILEIAEGQVIDLTGENLDIKIAQHYGISVDERQGTILYDNAGSHTGKPIPHSITVPIGAEYNFTLPDGTKVWLNSDSRITYPNFFDGDTRTVQLQGEAYFDVAKDEEHPFIVEFGKSQLEVTGTRFSISAYLEFSHAMATLEEGSIDVRYNGMALSLVPGRQAFIDNANETLTSREVNTRLYTSWVQGVFEYENMKLSDIAVQLSRWYDVDFSFASQTAKESRFTGVVIKYHDLNEALIIIEKTSDVEFIIDGRKISVMNR